MKVPALVFLFLLSAAVMTSLGVLMPAQTQSTLPPEIAAYNKAVNIRNPDLRFEALRNLLSDARVRANPNASRFVHQSLFDILIQRHPDREVEILEHARAVLASPDPVVGRIQIIDVLNLVKPLCYAAILPDFAASIARDALKVEQPDIFSPGRSTVVLELMGCLGRILVTQGQFKEAEGNLKQVLAANPNEPTALLAMAELHQKRGENGEALSAFVHAAAAQRIPPAAHKQMETLYAGFHNGSTAGLEEMVDQKYLEIHRPPFQVELYNSTPKRTVLIETFTSAGSAGCIATDRAMESAMERYSRAGVLFLMYHENFGESDPMSNPHSQARAGYYNLRMSPAAYVDGTLTSSMGARESFIKRVYDQIVEATDKRLKATAQIQLRLDTQLSDGVLRMTAALDNCTKASPDLRLYLVLAEEQLRYTGESGIRFHPMVVRSVIEIGPAQGLTIAGKEPHTITCSLDLKAVSTDIKRYLDEYETANNTAFLDKKHEINSDQLVVAAFVQDTKIHAVLQATMVRVKPPARQLIANYR